MSQQLIESLQNPALFDHPVTAFAVIETHISWVLLTGPYAYKIRKPVNLGFVDFSSLKLRQQDCLEELRLNRRQAEELYVDLVTIGGTEHAPELADNARPIEYAVRMHQFEQDQLLLQRERNGILNDTLLLPMAERLSQFHRDAPVASAESDYGTPPVLWQVISQNFDQIRPRLPDQTLLEQLAMLQQTARDEFQRLRPLLIKRRLAGRVRECHGDLHLGNIVWYQGRAIPFDCIEFNPRYRWIDTLNDLAFLLMDLEFCGHPALAARFLNRYLEFSGDYADLALLALFKSYRAMVRAKVALLGAPVGDPEALALCRRYLDLAASYANPTTPRLILMHGVSGSGKSVIADKLCQQSGWIRLRADRERKRIQRENATLPLYGTAMNDKTYARLYQLSASLLAAGFSVVVDATFNSHQKRQLFSTLAQESGVRWSILDCQCSQAVIHERILQREAQGNDPSDATPAVAEQQQKMRDPLTSNELAQRIGIATDRGSVTRRLQEHGLLSVSESPLHGVSQPETPGNH